MQSRTASCSCGQLSIEVDGAPLGVGICHCLACQRRTGSVFVHTNGDCAFRGIDPEGVTIWWGAYLGMPDEILIAGPLAEVAERIVEAREAARAAHGWIMDAYLMRRD